METHLPADKLQRTRELVSTWIFKKTAIKHRILLLIGVLQHSTRIIQPGRTFLSRMYARTAKLWELHFYTRLNEEFQSDLCWWDTFLESWNGLSLFQCTTTQKILTPGFSIQTDASDFWGCGNLFQERWLQLKWPPQWSTVNILFKELLSVVLSCAVWSPLLTQHKVLFQCYNNSVVEKLQKGSARDSTVMYVPVVLFMVLCAPLQYCIDVKTYCWVDNCTAADYLSKYNIHISYHNTLLVINGLGSAHTLFDQIQILNCHFKKPGMQWPTGQLTLV